MVIPPLSSFSKPNFPRSRQWITCGTLSCLQPLLYFYASILHSAAKCPVVSSLSPHIRHAADTSCLSSLLLILLVLSARYCAAVKNASSVGLLLLLLFLLLLLLLLLLSNNNLLFHFSAYNHSRSFHFKTIRRYIK